MAFSLSGLFQGANEALAGRNAGQIAGQVEEQNRQRQAAIEDAKLRLMAAQMMNFQSQAANRVKPLTLAERKELQNAPRSAAPKAPAPTGLQHITDPLTGQVFGWDRSTNTMTPATMATGTPPPTPVAPGAPSTPAPTTAPPQQPSAPPRPARLGVKPVVTTTYTPEGQAVRVTAAPSGRVTSVDTVGNNLGRPVTAPERQAGAQAASVEGALSHMERIAALHPEAFSAAIGFIRARAHGPLGRLASEARGGLSDADAQAVVQDYSNYILATIPNARPNQTTIELEQEASLPPFGSDPTAWGTAFRTMRDRASTLRAKAGRAAPPSTLAPPSRFLTDTLKSRGHP